MCNQSVGLVASVIEKTGVPTVCLSLLREVTEQVKPPRALFLPFRIGFPLGEPRSAGLQNRILRSALSLLEPENPLPVFADFG
jgi:hypothetical protein